METKKHRKIVRAMLLAAVLALFALTLGNLMGGVGALQKDDDRLQIYPPAAATLEGQERNEKAGLRRNRPTALSESVRNRLRETELSGGKEVAEETVAEETAAEDGFPVYISGKVAKAGVYWLTEGAILADALNLAGGATEEAAIERLNLAAVLLPHQMVYVPNQAEWIAGERPELSAAQGVQSRDQRPMQDQGSSMQPDGKRAISISTADSEILQQIPGVGEKTAALIIQYRTKNGAFQKIEDLMKVPGIKEGKFAAMRDYIVP